MHNQLDDHVQFYYINVPSSSSALEFYDMSMGKDNGYESHVMQEAASTAAKDRASCMQSTAV